SGQCLQQEGLHLMEASRKRLATPNLKPEEIAAANKGMQDGFKNVQAAVQYFEAQAAALKQQKAAPEPIARMHYEAAWGYRTLAEPEVAATRTKMQQDLAKKLHDEAVKKDPNYRPPAVAILPDVPLSQVPLQPSEQKARAQYQALITGFAE